MIALVMPPESISIATYNVLDLFDPDPAEPDGRSHLEAKLAFLAKKLDETDADVIGLQEIGSEEALASLASRLDASFDERSRRGVERDLTAAEDEIAGARRLRVGPDRGGRASGLHDGLGHLFPSLFIAVQPKLFRTSSSRPRVT